MPPPNLHAAAPAPPSGLVLPLRAVLGAAVAAAGPGSGTIPWLGLFSSHCREPHHFSAQTPQVLDLLAGFAAALIGNHRCDTRPNRVTARLRAVVMRAPIGIMQVDPARHTLLSANPSFCAMLGYREGELVGRHIIDDLTHPAHREADRLAAQRLQAGEIESHHPVKRYLHRSGDAVWCEAHSVAVRDAAGKARLTMAVVTDITEQRRVEERARAQLEEAFRLQREHTADELANALAHEINQPLAALSAYGEAGHRMLGQPELDRARLKEILASISEQAMRAGNIIRHMRGFYTNRATDPQPMDLNAVIGTSLQLMTPSASRQRIRLEADLAADLPPALGVAVHVEQVLLNLLRNAFDAIAEQPSGERTVTIRSCRLGDVAQATVTDTGPGIPAERASQLFGAIGSSKPNGLGLGLRISRGLMEAQGGRLLLEAHGPPGAALRLDLPLA